MLAAPELGDEPPQADSEPGELLDPHDPRTPRGAVRAYLDACRRGDFAAAARYLQMPDGAAADGAALARQLKVVLDQKLWVDLASLATDPEGKANDGLPGDVERIGSIESRQARREILIQRVHDGEEKVWRFSAATVSAVPDLYSEFGYGPLGELLPEEFFVFRFLEIQLWQWMGLFLLVMVAYVAGWLVTRITWRALSRLTTRTTSELDDRLLELSLRPLYLIAAVGLFHLGSALLRLSIPVRHGLAGVERALVLIGIVWLATKLVDLVAERTRARFEEEGRRAAVAIIPMGRKAAKAVLLLLGSIAMLQNLGFNVTGIVAGLGVGGIAVALAAQKSLENLFGGLMLVMDQPVRVGDFCRWGDKVGTVEEVGLRSTRVRTLDRTVISVPNAEFSNVQLENFAARDRIRLTVVLQLRYETTAEQMRHVLVGLRRLLAAHPRVLPDPARVRLVSFGSHSLDLEVFAYIDTPDWNEFLKVREDLFLRMIDVVAASGTGFAFPSQTLYLARDGGADDETRRSAEEEVRAWRRDGKLPFPDFAPATVESLRATLDYPPAGSESTQQQPTSSG